MGKQDGNRNPVVIVSPWRIREYRRQQAKAKDKRTIEELKFKVAWMEGQLQEWWGWYCKQPELGEAGVEMLPLHQCHQQREYNQQLQQQQQRRHGNIDYSRWDKLSCYSSEEGCYAHSRNEKETSEAEEVEEDEEEGIDLDEEHLWEEEDWMEADGSELSYSRRADSCRIGADQQISDEVAQKDQATCEESPAECMRRVEGTQMETLPLICDDCEQNKQACIAYLEDARASLSRCFKEADSATSRFDHLRHALAEQEKVCSQQASVYLQQMTSVPSAQYEREKAQSMVTLIAAWRDELTANVRALTQDCKRMSLEERKSQED